MTAAKKHILPDVLVPNLKIVFCGSAAGTKSAKLGLPYAGPGNTSTGPRDSDGYEIRVELLP